MSERAFSQAHQPGLPSHEARACASRRSTVGFRSATTSWKGALIAAACALLLTACAEAPRAPEKPVELVFPAPPDAPRFYFERSIYSSADVIPEQEASRLRRLITGQQRAGEGLGKPFAVAVHQGTVFVSDSMERFVKAFDFPSGRHYQIGAEAPGQLGKPLGMDVDGAGNVYVADGTANAILVYDKQGKYLRTIGGKGMFQRIGNVTVDPKGDRIYAVDIGGISSELHRVRVIDAQSGERLFDIGKRGSGDGELNLPRDIAVGQDGELYVVDGGNFRVQVFSREGKYLRRFGEIGRQYGTFSRPKEIATDANGNIYVVDTAFGNFQIFNREGQLLLFVGTRSEKDGPAKYMLPSGIFVDEDGRVYMVDQWFRKVEVYRPANLPAGSGFLARRPSAPATAAAKGSGTKAESAAAK